MELPLRHTEVVKHSAAIAISNEVTLLQRRAWNVMLAHAFDGLIERDSHVMGLADLVAHLGITTRNVTHLRDTLRGLVDTKVEWDVLGKGGKRRWGVAALLAHVEVEAGHVEYSFALPLRERLYRPDIYARISLSVQNKFKSKYALALYELLVDYLGVGQTGWIELETFRRLMGVAEGEHPEYKKFNQRIVQVALREVNKLSDITVSVETRRPGRQVEALKFKARAKQATAAAEVEKVQARTHKPVLPPATGGRLVAPAEEPDAYETWFAALAPLEQSSFEARASAIVERQHPDAKPMSRKAFVWMTMRELWAAEQARNVE